MGLPSPTTTISSFLLKLSTSEFSLVPLSTDIAFLIISLTFTSRMAVPDVKARRPGAFPILSLGVAMILAISKALIIPVSIPFDCITGKREMLYLRILVNELASVEFSSMTIAPDMTSSTPA